MFAITGATGHTGKIVAKRLLERGEEVRAIGRSERNLQPLVELGARAFVADIADAGTLHRAFAGAKAVYIVMPQDMGNKNYRAFQDHVSDAVASAVAAAGVEFAVVLSSIGADKAEKTGPVTGLHYLEKRLDAIGGLNVLYLRCGYFMENTLAQAGIIHAMNVAAGTLRPDLKVPMIATTDIGNRAADELLSLDFDSSNNYELLGQRDLSLSEAAGIMGRAIGKPDLTYAQISDEQFRNAVAQMGMSTNVANSMLEMTVALNSGYMRALEKRNVSNTTPTSFETFVSEQFVPVYEGRLAPV